MLDDERRDFTRPLQIGRVFRLAKHHGIAVKPPCLAACPGGAVCCSLHRLACEDVAAFRIVIHEMIAAGVVAEMILPGSIGVTQGDLPQPLSPTLAGGESEQFEVHHVIDDDRIFPAAEVPGTDLADLGIEARGKRLRALHQDPAVALVLRQAVAVAITATEHEPDVMITGVVLEALQPRGVILGRGQPLRLAGGFIKIPQ